MATETENVQETELAAIPESRRELASPQLEETSRETRRPESTAEEQTPLRQMSGLKSASELETNRQLSEHIKRFYSIVKRIIVIFALVSFLISTVVTIIQSVLSPSSPNGSERASGLSEVEKHIARLLQLVDIAFATGNPSGTRIGAVFGNNTD